MTLDSLAELPAPCGEEEIVEEWIGVNQGDSLGWCSSDLDQELEGAYSAEECWNLCTSEFGEDIQAIDFYYSDNSCYCQNDCPCLSDVGDEDQVLMTSEWMTEFPVACDSDEWLECSLAVKTEVLMIDAGNVYETSIF
jgi:hypothetical protein